MNKKKFRKRRNRRKKESRRKIREMKIRKKHVDAKKYWRRPEQNDKEEFEIDKVFKTETFGY